MHTQPLHLYRFRGKIKTHECNFIIALKRSFDVSVVSEFGPKT